MWVMVMFDLPVTEREDRREYARFRKRLLNNGFWQLQYSVYARPCETGERAEQHRARIERHVPQEGQVRILMFTDKQWGRMQVFFGKKPSKAEKKPEQLSFF